MKSNIREILEWLVCIIIAVVLALLVRYFIGTPTVVKMTSMKPTLLPEQRLILNRWTRTTNKMPERGDIVTLEAPSKKLATDTSNVVAVYDNEPTNWFSKFVYYFLEIGKESYIKRVIALPGEHLEIKDGKVYINGEELDEPYLQDNVVTQAGTEQNPYYDLIVPENCVFVMGDNRSGSTDSRSFGCVPLDKLEGTVWIRFWPLNLFGKID